MLVQWRLFQSEIRKGLKFHVKYLKIGFTSVQMYPATWKHYSADPYTVNDRATICHIDCIHEGQDSPYGALSLIDRSALVNHSVATPQHRLCLSSILF